MRRPVIVVPGYYGSKLAEAMTGEIVWLTAQGLLHPATTARAIRFDPKDPDRVVPVAILDEVPLILPFFDLKVYQGLLEFLLEDQKLPPESVLPFYYDWRRSFEDAADALAGQIRRLVAETGSSKVDLIAHSFGGLVARACLAKHDLAEKVEWLVTLGTPHKGMQRTFRALTKGAKVLTFSEAETRDTARTFPSSYELVPSDAADGLFSVNGNPSDAFSDPSWCEDQRMRDLLAEAESVARRLLPSTLPVKTCFVYGTRLDTTTHAQSDGGGDVEFFETTDGDSTVPRVSAIGQGLDGTDEVLRFQVPLAVHSQLPSDEIVQQKILTPLLLDRPFPQVMVFIRFHQQPFFIPRSKNPLAIAVVDQRGEPRADADVRLTMIGSTIVGRTVPFDPARGDYFLNVTMPGPSVPHRQWRIEVDVPGQPTFVDHGLLVSAG